VVPPRPRHAPRCSGHDERLGEGQRSIRVAGISLSNFESANYEVIAAGLSGDLAYLVCLEHTTGSFGGSAVAPYSLRVTTIFRREDNEWKIVHRHADSYNPSTSDIDRRS
jgi:ketosteroid isomerase-like protein